MITKVGTFQVGTGFHVVLSRKQRDVDCAMLLVLEALIACPLLKPTDRSKHFSPRFGDKLHPTVIEQRMQDIYSQGLQFFAGTMNPAVLDHMQFTSAEDVRMHVFYADETLKERLYRMTEEQAERFFRYYSVGIQHVSEILLTEGLW